MQTQRGLVDYTLQRRRVLSSLQSGQATVAEVCDASPYLVRAAKFHGQSTDLACPVCRKENLTLVHWVFGDELGQAAGSARTPEELDRLAEAIGEFDVRQVEVCRSCSWNHVVLSFVLGHRVGPPIVPVRRRSAPS